jgi:deoxyribonuclease-4
MAQTAESIGANVFQFFTRNPRGGAAKPLDRDDTGRFMEFAAERGIGPILAHAPYTLNAASADERTREFARSVFLDDLKRLEATPGAMYNFHPGSHVGQGAEKGIELVASMLKSVFGDMGEISTTVLLETMSGKGSEIGRDFAELRRIMDMSGLPLGVCLDTCHVWDGGYDIVDGLDGVLSAFDREIGLENLKAVHINDSMNVLGAHKDRHEKIGKGKIGLEAFRRIVNHPSLRDLPFYLETPCDLQGYKDEIALLKGLCE